MNNHPTVTLCIPTFQRSGCLATLLESVASQSPPFSEVVISDDCSGDDTEAVVATFQARIPNLRYHRCPENVGLDENFRVVASLAKSKYAWFMGDDDRLRPGAVGRFCAALSEYPDILGITFASVDYDASLTEPTGLKKARETQVVSGAAALFSEHIDILGFMSTTVVDRHAWESVPTSSIGRFDNLYSQVHRIGELLGENGRWLISEEITVDYRSDNDQFNIISGGDLPRLMRDVTSYRSIIWALLEDQPHFAFIAMDRILRTHIVARVRNGKLKRAFPWIEAIRYLTPVFKSHRYYWVIVVPTLVMPRIVIVILKGLFQRYHPSSGVVRAKAQHQTMLADGQDGLQA